MILKHTYTHMVLSATKVRVVIQERDGCPWVSNKPGLQLGLLACQACLRAARQQEDGAVACSIRRSLASASTTTPSLRVREQSTSSRSSSIRRGLSTNAGGGMLLLLSLSLSQKKSIPISVERLLVSDLGSSKLTNASGKTPSGTRQNDDHPTTYARPKTSHTSNLEEKKPDGYAQHKQPTHARALLSIKHKQTTQNKHTYEHTSAGASCACTDRCTLVFPRSSHDKPSCRSCWCTPPTAFSAISRASSRSPAVDVRAARFRARVRGEGHRLTPLPAACHLLRGLRKKARRMVSKDGNSIPTETGRASPPD